MKTLLEQVENGIAKLTLEFDQVASGKAYNFVLKEIGKDVKVPGFAVGKVPRSIIEQRIGLDTLKARAVEKLIRDHIDSAIGEQKIDLLSTPIWENSNFDFENTLSVTLKLELRPIVNLGEYSKLVLELPVVTIKDVTLDTLLANLARELAPWIELSEGHKVELEDKITIDFSGRFPDGLALPDGDGTDIALVVKPENFVPGVMDQLIGTKIGETREVKSSFPGDYPDAELAGKEVLFTVTLKKLERKTPLPIDENLAIQAGRKDLAELKASLEEEIANTKRNAERKRLQAIAAEKILEIAKIDLPDWLVEREAQAIAKAEAHRKLHEDHHHDEHCDHKHDELEAEVQSSHRDQAKRRLTLNLAMSHISIANQISVTKEELNDFIGFWVKMRGLAPDQITREMVQYFAESILFDKILDWIVSQAEIKEIPETEENLAKLRSISEEMQNLTSHF
ncbi:MAG: trigger factor [Candidatus Caenarcaniphilales bacterium]|nr:trigger factor [Candidatus Caenarcaniphilales bacterium]